METLLFSLTPALLIWTVFALLMLLVLRFNQNGSPLLNYHLSTATLIALPAGLLLAPFLTIPAVFQPVPAINNWLFTAVLPEISITSAGSAEPAAASQATESQSAAGPFSLTLLFAVLLAAAVTAGLIRLLYIYARLKHSLGKAEPVTSPQLIQQAETLRKTLGISRRVRLFRSDEAAIPFTTGIFRPVIVLPVQSLQNADAGQLRLILTHEMIHIARNDYAAHLGELFIRHLFWMHPLVHLLYRQAAYYREVSCDREVLRINGESEATYAELLYRFALLEREKPQFRAAMAEEHKLLRRIRNLNTIQANTTQPTMITMKKSLLASAALMLMIAGVMACSDLTQNADPSATVVNLDDSIELYGQTITLREFRERIAEDRQNLLRGIEEATENTNPQTVQFMRDTAQELGNVLMLIDNGQASRAIAVIESLSPPPPPVLGESESSDVFVVVEEMPQMIGGQLALFNALRYPEAARRAGIEGRVILQFIVDEEGNVINPTVVRSAGAGGLDEAALEAISQMQFTPGIQRGRPVKVQMTQPVVFRLGDSASMPETTQPGTAVLNAY